MSASGWLRVFQVVTSAYSAWKRHRKERKAKKAERTADDLSRIRREAGSDLSAQARAARERARSVK